MWCNLFSITSAMKKGFELSSKDMQVKVKNGNFEFVFDKMGETVSGGFLMGIEIMPQLSDQTMIQNGNEEGRIQEQTMDINTA